MRIGAILPHLQANGGVRRFLEIGNELIKKGHEYTVFTPKNAKKTKNWVYKGNFGYWKDIDVDILLCGDVTSPESISAFEEAPTLRKYVYVIIGSDLFIARYKNWHLKFPFLLNNRVFTKYFSNESYLLEGGVSDFWKPDIIRVGYQARKGGEIVNALEQLKHIELVPLAGKQDDELRELYRSCDYVVTWEHREGWCNTAAEALACGVPVVTNGVNCEPFIEKCIVVKDLKDYFVNPMEKFSYKNIADKLEKIWS